MGVADYTPPVSQLLTLGQPNPYNSDPKQWRNYLELGLGPESIPDLIRMATDKDLNFAMSDTQEVWGPMHSWRTLAQLHAQEAIEPLLVLFERLEDDEWATEELPTVYSRIGPATIPTLAVYLADTNKAGYARITAAAALTEIGKDYPEVRTECVNILTRQLEHFRKRDAELNGFLISDLIDLKAVEALAVIEQAFAAKAVDLMVAGDWNDVQIEFGLKSVEELEHERDAELEREVAVIERGGSYQPSTIPTQAQKAKAKAKRKMAKESRKKNRKRK